MTTIVPLDPMWVRFKVTEDEYLAMKAGRTFGLNSVPPITLLLADNSAFPNKGKIENTTNQVDPRLARWSCRRAFPIRSITVLPGQFGRVQVETQMQHNVVLVPQRAILQVQNLRSVYTVEAGRQNRGAAGHDGATRRRELDHRIGFEAGRSSGGGRTDARTSGNGSEAPAVALFRVAEWPHTGRRRRVAMARFFIDRPVFAMVIAIVICILGAVAIPNLPIATYPEVVPPVVQITANYLGGNATDLEKTVAQPIEEQLVRPRWHVVLSLDSANNGSADDLRDIQAGH